jgi:hypothetical protein
MISPTQLAAIREREQRATPGPWTSGGAYVHATMKCPGEGECPFEDCELDEPEHEFVIATCEQDYEADRDIDGPFIAHARTDIPALIAALEEQARELRELDVPLPVVELTKLRDEVRADQDRLSVTLAMAFDLGVKAARAALAGGEEG